MSCTLRFAVTFKKNQTLYVVSYQLSILMMQLFYQFETSQLFPCNFFWILIEIIQNFDLLHQALKSSFHFCTKLLLTQSHASKFLCLLWKTWLKYLDLNYLVRLRIDPWSRIVTKVQWWSMVNKKFLLMLKFPSWLTTASRFWNATRKLAVTMRIWTFGSH